MPRGAPRAHLLHDVPKDGWVGFISSNVIGGRYDEENEILWIKFGNNKGGKKRPVTYYSYAGVPSSIWRGLLGAGSKGVFFDRHIKNAGFAYASPIAG